MPLSTLGLYRMLDLTIGVAVTAFNNANAHIGVGGGAGATTAFAVGQTDLQGASKTRKAMDATYPSRATNVITFRSTFGSADANHAWDELGFFDASSAGTMLARDVEAHGTKVSGDSWVFTVTETVTLA